jgi:hypothetical protein
LNGARGGVVEGLRNGAAVRRRAVHAVDSHPTWPFACPLLASAYKACQLPPPHVAVYRQPTECGRMRADGEENR